MHVGNVHSKDNRVLVEPRAKKCQRYSYSPSCSEFSELFVVSPVTWTLDRSLSFASFVGTQMGCSRQDSLSSLLGFRVASSMGFRFSLSLSLFFIFAALFFLQIVPRFSSLFFTAYFFCLSRVLLKKNTSKLVRALFGPTFKSNDNPNVRSF